MSFSETFGCIVQRVKHKDDAAMCELIKLHIDEFERYASNLVGPSLQAYLDPADAVQTVSVILWLGIRSGQFTVSTSDQFIALAKTLLRRHIARCWRKARKERTARFDESMIETVADQDLYFTARPTSQASDKCLEIDELLDRFLGQIDETDQHLIKMRFLGFTTKEVAKRLQLDPGCLRMRLVRIRRRFWIFWQKRLVST